MPHDEIKKAVELLKAGKVIAYPTEAVYGFGCDPFNINAIGELLKLKHRPMNKGLILVAHDFEQIENLIEPIEPRLLAHVLSTWPGPITWAFPASPEVPYWIRGKHKTIAVRISDHPLVQQLTKQFGPLVSTSANTEGHPPARDHRTAMMAFADKVDLIMQGQVSGIKNPTQIRNAVTGEILRPN